MKANQCKEFVRYGDKILVVDFSNTAIAEIMKPMKESKQTFRPTPHQNDKKPPPVA